MSRKDLFISALALVLVGGLLWLVVNALGGWMPLWQAIVGMGFIAIILFGVLALVAAVIYIATIWRAEQYARRLREDGYAVWLRRDVVWRFILTGLMTVILVPSVSLATYRLWDIHTCIQAGQCSEPYGWYIAAPVMLFVFWAMALYGLCESVHIWRRSFRPLRQYYEVLRRGRTPDLPRLLHR